MPILKVSSMLEVGEAVSCQLGVLVLAFQMN